MYLAGGLRSSCVATAKRTQGPSRIFVARAIVDKTPPCALLHMHTCVTIYKL